MRIEKKEKEPSNPSNNMICLRLMNLLHKKSVGRSADRHALYKKTVMRAADHPTLMRDVDYIT